MPLPLIAIAAAAAPLLRYALELVPDLVGAVAGDKSGKIAGRIVDVVQVATKNTDVEGVRAAIHADPAVALQVQLGLAQIAKEITIAERQAELAAYTASLADVASARQQTVALAAIGNPMAWGAPIISLVITVGFFGSLYMMATRTYSPDASISAILNIMIGALGAAFTGVTTYWLGSSAGSARKTDIIAAQQQPQAQQAPPIATTGDVTVHNPGPAGSPVSGAPGVVVTPPEPSPPGTTADDLNAEQLGEKPRKRVPAGTSTHSTARIDAALAVTFREEGGYANKRRDKGGPTNMGITFRTLANWRGVEPSAISPEDVQALTKGEARDIYAKDYWFANRCDQMAPGVDAAVFDFCVNSGRAVKVIQETFGVKVDGAVGPLTLAALASLPAADVVNRICDARLAYVRTLDDWDAFGDGWTARIARVREKALAMAGA